MKNKMLLLSVVVGSVLASGVAYTNDFAMKGLNFIAPTINDKTNVYDPQIGEIVYDSSDSKFYGRDQSGTWQVFAAPVPTERTERIFVGSSGAIISQSNSWVSSVNHVTNSGDYTFNFSSAFSSPPTCVATGVGGGYIMSDRNPSFIPVTLRKPILLTKAIDPRGVI